MGAANVIPGASGSSVAFITGIYHEMLHSLASIDRDAFKLLFQFKVADFWKKINGNFLAVLLAGIVTSFFALARLMTYLLTHHAILVGSFFFGMILISMPLVLREIKRWNIGTALSFVAGIGIAYGLTLLTRIQTPDAVWVIFIAGILTTCAMMFPGVSSSFALFLLGKYQFMRSAVLQFNIPIILIFLAGCALGLIGSSRFLSWILDSYHSATVALLSGLMLGSLNKVWPWREVVEYVTNGKGEQIPVFDKSILPWNYFTITGKDPQVFQAILMMALGVFIVVLIEKIAARLKTKI